MASRPHISDDERRARLVARHHLDRKADAVVEAVRALVAVHSSDPVTPHLAMWARVDGFDTGDLDAALCDSRDLWRLHAMRRTLFVVAADEAPVFDAAASRDIARKERRQVEKWLGAELGAGAVKGWLKDVEARTLEALSDGAEHRTQDLAEHVPELRTEVTLGSGKWTQRSPIGSRLLFVLAMEGRVVRTRPAGTWRSSQYHWVAAPAWFEGDSDELDPAAGRAALARRYLASFGPVTRTDVRWWTGWTAKRTDAALEAAGAVLVELDGGGEGYVLEGDVESGPRIAEVASVALLPGLDSTPMGWKERDWYLGPHEGPESGLFDRNGNVGPTVWVDGLVVGGWAQRPDGEVVVRVLEDVGAERRALVDAEAARLTEWMGGVQTTPRFRTPLERELSG